MLSDKIRANLEKMHKLNIKLLDNSTTLKNVEKQFPNIYKDIHEAVAVYDEHIMDVLQTEKLTTDKIMIEKLTHIQQEGKQIEQMIFVVTKMLTDKSKEKENKKDGRK